MRIRMIGARLVAADGLHIATWPDGSVHEVTDDFAAPLIRDGWAVDADAEPKVIAPTERKVKGPAERKGA